MTKPVRRLAVAAGCLALAAAAASAQTVGPVSFVNGIAIDGGALDLSSGSAFERRVGFFSDLYYDRVSKSWLGLSDRGPGGGSLPYDTRLQRFTLEVGAGGAIANFKIVETVKFTMAGQPFTGLAPNPTNMLARSFDPEGVVINPRNGNLLVSDEYGPALYEFDRKGVFIRAFTTPANVLPRDAATGTPNFAGDTGNTAGKRTNRGFEGLAIGPDGRHAYAVLQSATLDEGGGDGTFIRIVKFDTATGLAVAQFAYELDTAKQGRGISALVALGNEKFLILERNNRGVGVGATLDPADKNVYTIDLAGATDVSGIDLDAEGAVFTPVAKGTKVIDLDADTLAALGKRSPEKWEGLAIGPQLADGSFLVLAGTDNDYSVTQNDSGTQFDVYFRFSDADPFATAIQCPIGATTGCTAPLTADHALLPGVLHAYSADIDGYSAPIPEPGTHALLLAGLGLVGFMASRNRPR